MLLIYIFIYGIYFSKRKSGLLFPYSSQLLDSAGLDCCIPCVRQVPSIAGS